MGFTYKDWKNRIATRSDITGMVTHLTRPMDTDVTEMTDDEINKLAVDNLINILEEGIIYGSTTEKGFIVGSTPAVCFQDAPLYGLVQNVEHERVRRINNPKEKYRYCGVGLGFGKGYIFEKGGRPVIYEQTDVAKTFLPPNEHWRIVNYRIIPGESKIIDWTHEREWRLPGNLQFDVKLTHVVLYDEKCWNYFLERCPEDIVKQVWGVSTLKGILM